MQAGHGKSGRLKPIEIKSSSVFPQPRPNALYMGGPVIGIRALTMQRHMILAVDAEAVCTVKALGR